MTNNAFIKGMAFGILTGAAISFAAMPKSKGCKRTTGKFLKTAGEIIENFGGMWS